MAQLEIVIPLWNEAKNLPFLVDMLEKSPLINDGTLVVTLVNNGSTDNTKLALKELLQERPWLRGIELEVNQNYGGGIFFGLKHSTAPYVGFIPGDLQIQMNDLETVWRELQNSKEPSTTLSKGSRKYRQDGFSSRLVSRVYTRLANFILGIHVNDLNGLPKIFHRNLLQLLSDDVMKTFVFDAQILATAHHHGWTIKEVPVTFYARREGVSSWSGQRLKVYLQSFRRLLYLRQQFKKK